ncbi:hypothetical protein ACA910_013286 [Epithemia clementina (nom. ined.)]
MYRILAVRDPEWFAEYVVSTLETPPRAGGIVSSQNSSNVKITSTNTPTCSLNLTDLIEEFKRGEINSTSIEDNGILSILNGRMGQDGDGAQASEQGLQLFGVVNSAEYPVISASTVVFTEPIQEGVASVQNSSLSSTAEGDNMNKEKDTTSGAAIESADSVLVATGSDSIDGTIHASPVIEETEEDKQDGYQVDRVMDPAKEEDEGSPFVSVAVPFHASETDETAAETDENTTKRVTDENTTKEVTQHDPSERVAMEPLATESSPENAAETDENKTEDVKQRDNVVQLTTERSTEISSNQARFAGQSDIHQNSTLAQLNPVQAENNDDLAVRPFQNNAEQSSKSLSQPSTSSKTQLSNKQPSPTRSKEALQTMVNSVKEAEVPQSIGTVESPTPEPSSLPASASTGPTTSEARTSTAVDEENNQSRVVVYRIHQSSKYKQTPLSEVQKLGYSEEEILALDPEALASIVSNQVRRPQRGLPPRWKGIVGNKSTGRLVQIIPSSEVAKLVGDMAYATPQPTTGKGSATAGTTITTTWGEANRDAGEKTNATATESPRYVVFKQGSSKQAPFSRISLDRLKALGYNEKDLTSLRPSALDLIVGDKVPRPKSGIPSRWRLTNPEGLAIEKTVQIMDSDQSITFLKKFNRREQPDAAGVSLDDRSQPFREKLSGGTRNLPSDNSRRSEGRVRSSSRESGQTKPIYTGRRPVEIEHRLRKADPPPPRYWPDIDTFRSLLREEAKLRVAVVGEDLSGLVKQECEWRLQLYKDWLWVLHDGIGNPIVESRSDRARRLNRGKLPASANGREALRIKQSRAARPKERRKREIL